MSTKLAEQWALRSSLHSQFCKKQMDRSKVPRHYPSWVKVKKQQKKHTLNDLEVSCFLSWTHSRLLLYYYYVSMCTRLTSQANLWKSLATRVTMSSQTVPKVTLTAKSFECKSWCTYLHWYTYSSTYVLCTNPSLNTQSCIRRPLCSTGALKFEAKSGPLEGLKIRVCQL